MTVVNENQTRVEGVCGECQQTCESGVYDCCAKSGQSDQGQRCLDCTPICSGCVTLASSNPDWAAQLCQLCPQLCEVCTAEVGGEDGQHGGEWARSCRQCADRCLAAA